VLIAPLAVIAIVVGIASLVLHGFPTSLAQGLDNATQGNGSPHGSAPAGHTPSPAHDPGARHSGTPGSQRTPGNPSPTGKPSVTGKPSPSPKPTPSGTHSPSHSPSPSPTPTPNPGPVPPPGYVWYSVSASSVGTTAGFRVAAPGLWVMTPGLTTTIRPLVGGVRLSVDMAPLAVQGPYRDAHHMQAVALALHTYRQYHLVSILAATYRGRPAATWSFWWKPSAVSKVIDVTKLIYTAITPAGAQPYILTISAPGPSAASADHVFRVALRTFEPRP